MNSKKLFLSVFLILMLIFPPLGCSSEPTNDYPKSIEGNLDLTQWQLQQKVIKLDGQWEFYWNHLLEPQQLKETPIQRSGYIYLPSSWNGHIINEQKLPGEGYATYRLHFKTVEKGRLGLKIPRIFTSYKLWINDELIASAGTVGKNRGTMTPQYLPQVAFFEAQPGDNEIILQVTNFYHRNGGILESIILGSEKQILEQRHKSIALDLALFSSLIIIGLYHLALFFFRKKDYAPLYFGLFCLLVGIRTLLVGERFFIYLFPSFNWEVAHKILTLTYYLGVPLIVMFFKSVLPNDLAPKMVRIVQVVGLLFGLLVIFTPAKIFTLSNPPYQLFSLLVIIYITIIFIKKIYKGETGVGLIVAGGMALFITSINDIIFASIWMNDHSSSPLRILCRTGNLASIGQLIFVFTNSLVLAIKFSNALEKEEVMAAQLKEMNLNLDKLVIKRTKSLEKSRLEISYQKAELEQANRALQLLSLKDPLTNLWNRRHFDDTLQIEWRRGLRHQRSVSLMILDIDYFKLYNDHYGHSTGDECLVQVAQAINDSFSRGSDLVARYGGEEFVVVLPELEKNDAIKMALLVQKNIEILKIPHNCSPVHPYVTVSIGVTSMIPNTNGSPKDLILTADKALYQAKAAGRNQVKFLA